MIARRPGRAPLAGLVLAAGRSTRFGTRNKLTVDWGGEPLLRGPVRAAIEAGLAPVVVVTASDEVAAVVSGAPVRRVDVATPDGGVSASLRAGLGALPAEVAGTFVLLGDMPLVTADHLARLARAFSPDRDRSIVVPTSGGRRGNPVLWAAAHFAEMAAGVGDVGARHLFARHASRIVEVALDDAVLRDVDVEADLDRLAALGPPRRCRPEVGSRSGRRVDPRFSGAKQGRE